MPQTSHIPTRAWVASTLEIFAHKSPKSKQIPPPDILQPHPPSRPLQIPLLSSKISPLDTRVSRRLGKGPTLADLTPQQIVLVGFGTSAAAGLAAGVGALPGLPFCHLSRRTLDILLGFATGVMLAATSFSLVVPSIRYGEVIYGHALYTVAVMVGGEEEVEIGIIRDLAEFPEPAVRLIREALARRYFVHAITRIRHIGWKYGFVSMDVETDKGPTSFLMPWRHNRATDYGRHGKILIDVDNNRYLIPDLQKLSPRELREFQRYIYW